MLATTAKQLNPDIILVQEPYVLEGKIEGLPSFWKSWLSKNNKAGIIALPSCNNPVFLFSSNEIVAIKIQANSSPFTIISSYSSPYSAIEHNLDETHQLIHSLQGEDFLLGADLNAHSQTWGYSNTNTRGEKVSDFISSINGHLLNTKDAPPTFIKRDSKGWPDLSIASSSVLAVNSDWQVLDNIESYSDHKIISITINKDQHILKYNRFKTIFGGHKKFSTILKSKAHSILKRISDTVHPEDIDDLTVFIQQELNFACRKAYKLKKTPTTPTISWWNSNLETKKKEITALKRRAERSNGLVKTHFEIKAKMKLSVFKKEVLQAKRNIFKKNCSQENEAYGKFFKMAFQKTAPPTDIFSQINNDHNGSPIEIAQSILQSLYPITTDVTAQNTSSQPHNLEPPFTNKELKTIIKTLPNNKAPGNDGIDFIIIKQIFKSCPSILRNFFNKCLQFQRFPKSLKEGIIVLFHKKGKEPRNISSYRPITLLPTLGKLLEKLLLQRFNYYLEKNNKLHDQQYGFRQGKSVDLALSTLVSKLEEAKRKDLQTLFISIDIKGAFDNLQYSSIKNSIDKIATKSNITETLKDILNNRKVIIQTQIGPSSWPQTRGCAQGSCSGPAFWNLVADNILNADWPPDVHLQAFADDFAFVISHRTKKGVQELAKKAIQIFSNWVTSNKLEISFDKTKYMYIGKLVNPARIKWNNERIQKVWSLKYLGVVIHSTLSWVPHIIDRGTKSLDHYHQLQRIAGKNWGLSQTNRKLIYKTVTERMICHGSVAWALNISERMKRKLNSFQRRFLLIITKAYHTTSTLSLQILTGIPPLHLTLSKEAKNIKITRLRQPAIINDSLIDPSDYEEILRGHQFHPADFKIDFRISTEPAPNYPIENSIYTDGSKTTDGTGSAFCSFDDLGQLKTKWLGKLSQDNNIFQAELLAIHQAILHHINSKTQVKIWSDSLSSLQAILNPTSPHPLVRDIQKQLQSKNNIYIGWVKAHIGHYGNETADELAKKAINEGTIINIKKPLSSLKKSLNQELLEKWQLEWNKGKVGRLIHEIIPSPSFKLHKWSRGEIMFFSEHGPFPSYLRRFNLKPTDLCNCGDVGTPLHYATSCILTESWHFKKPSTPNLLHWKKGILKNKAARIQLGKLMDFLMNNDDLINGS
ncbi:Putative protein in type-1 retrotransposable element R1DM [Araneus ventricosus]|uniref:Retrovirus-related Pol polyprotein from type-1 retrotransposable element R1 n=2 Tax=Araneus ventricosus TaxID=182803 RepID=A0A4Y2JU75_ARAVE|nr:Putative protein in type-1 retrotransposable element R1DM [Araneus ventricosus]